MFGHLNSMMGQVLFDADAVDSGHQFQPIGEDDEQDEGHEEGKEVPRPFPGGIVHVAVGKLDEHLEKIVEASGNLVGRARSGAQGQGDRQDNNVGDDRGDEGVGETTSKQAV